MGAHGWLVIIIGICLLALRGLSFSWFTVDWVVVTIYFIFSIPFFARFLKKAKLPGTEFEFKDTIERTKKVLTESEQSALKVRQGKQLLNKSGKECYPIDINPDNSSGKSSLKKLEADGEYLSDQFFDLSSPRALAETDPVLALAALRIEIEKKFKLWSKDASEDTSKYSLGKIISLYGKNDWMNSAQLKALQNITKMCNEAIHGAEVSYDIAIKIIDLTAEVNKTFCLGYSNDFTPLKNHQKYGIACPWEHCIENMPFDRGEAECPIFGHVCPGGEGQASICSEEIESG
ncbi:MAG: hypothetical protein KQH53_17795 [Desulfarculaceae bacterium]|nr:hypothetical protein [Desulfarculaceae bacterium]